MNEEYIRKIYDNLGGESKFGSYDSYYKLITTDDAYIQKIHSAFGDDVLGSFDGFSTLVKKKRRTYGFRIGRWFIGITRHP